MRNVLNKVLKVSSIVLLSLLLLGAVCWGSIFVQTKQYSTNVSSDSVATDGRAQQIAEQLIQNFEIDRPVVASSVTANNASLGAGLNLVKFDVTKDTDYYVVVVFANLTGGPTTWLQSDVDKVMSALNDDDPNNDIYSVREYFKEQSYGKVNFKAGYTIQTVETTYSQVHNVTTTSSSAYNIEDEIFSEATKQIGEIYYNGTERITNFHCRLLHYPYESDTRGEILWPHAWSNGNFVSSPQVIVNGTREDNSPFTGTYAHEFSHAFGVPDLYLESGSDKPVGTWFIMASTDYNCPQSLNAYFKEYLGFASSSPYGYNDDSKIRTITCSGDYVLAPCNSQTGTVAFKFAERTITMGEHQNSKGVACDPNETATEMFFVEYKVKSTSTAKTDHTIPYSGLVIYRVVASKCTEEMGNLHPERLGEVKYYVYILRNSLDGITDASNAAIKTNNSFGSTAVTSAGNKVIDYYDGTNTRIVITNNGVDEDDNVKVNFLFADELNRYSASGVFKVDGVIQSGVNVLIQKPLSTGGFDTIEDTGVTTDENGYFFVDGLVNGTKISFEKSNGEVYNSTLIIDEGNLLDQQVNEKTIFQVTLNFTYKDNNIDKPLVGVEVYKKGTSVLVATSGADGSAQVQLQLGQQLEFKLASYSFAGSFTFQNASQLEYSIRGEVPNTSSKVQINVKDASGFPIDNVEIYDVSDNEALLPATKTEEGYYSFTGTVGSVVRVFSNGYAPVKFTITQTDFTSLRDITLYEYQSATIIVTNARGEYISDVEISVDGEYCGRTGPSGEYVLANVAKGQTISFNHKIYRVDDYLFNGNASIIAVQVEYKQVNVLLQFYKPKNFEESNKLTAVQVSSGLTVFVENSAVDLSVYDNKLCFSALYYSNIYFASSQYAITDKNGKILMAGESGIPLIIDPTNAISNSDGYITFQLFAKKRLDLTGTVEFPKDAKVRKVEIFIGGARIAETDENGNFVLEDVIEGDEIIFQCDGYEFSKYYVVDTTEPMKITANPEDPFEYLAIYILFGVLAVCFVVPFFVGLTRKK